ncbi:Gfo/Idh/MocA family oxidoreductase [Secundilactobacillus odoratitofui]|uniref:Gfo/Idh/MocA family oxidoreductase n=1 Tax=Secundilactobacillus odoratitofui TaxID=480930 RepID=UPI000B1C37D9|nr:Gfo/Idh/MocA family oxidoreductase [Secundilactobacillus odoratitofui]
MKQIHAGIIGLGRAGQMHLNNLMTMPDIKIVQVADVFIENISEKLNGMGITNQTRDYHELLSNPEIDTVFIFTSTDTHEEIVTAAAKAGKNIFCEKPLSMNQHEEASLNVLQAVKDAGVKLQIGFNRRMDHSSEMFMKMFATARLGLLRLLRLHHVILTYSLTI